MSYAFPIYHKVTACNYKGDKSWGSKDTSQEVIFVGSSVSNSHELASTVTTKRHSIHEKWGDVIIFKYSVDDKILKESIFKNNNGVAGELLKERTALSRVKGL